LYLVWEAPFLFWDAYFHKINGREMLSRSPKDLNPTDNKVGLTKSFSPSTEQHKHACDLKMYLKFLLIFKIYYYRLHLVITTCNKIFK
jgi:hypothetical protein